MPLNHRLILLNCGGEYWLPFLPQFLTIHLIIIGEFVQVKLRVLVEIHRSYRQIQRFLRQYLAGGHHKLRLGDDIRYTAWQPADRYQRNQSYRDR